MPMGIVAAETMEDSFPQRRHSFVNAIIQPGLVLPHNRSLEAAEKQKVKRTSPWTPEKSQKKNAINFERCAGLASIGSYFFLLNVTSSARSEQTLPPSSLKTRGGSPRISLRARNVSK